MLRIKETDINHCPLQRLEELSVMTITRSNELVNDMKKEVQKYQKLLELAETDRIKVIKNEVNYYDFDYCFKRAWDYFEAKKENKLKEKGLTQNKGEFDYLVHRIEEILGVEGIKIKCFSQMGYAGYSYIIYFSYQGIVFEFEVPNMKLFDKKYFESVHAGKMSLFYEKTENSLHYVVASYDENEIKDSFQKFIAEKK
jgi:hypothetical protein